MALEPNPGNAACLPPSTIRSAHDNCLQLLGNWQTNYGTDVIFSNMLMSKGQSFFWALRGRGLW